MQALIFILLYDDNVVLFACTYFRRCTKAYEGIGNFCIHTKLSVNSSKPKIMLMKNQKQDKPCIMCNNGPLDCVKSFKFLGNVTCLINKYEC